MFSPNKLYVCKYLEGKTNQKLHLKFGVAKTFYEARVSFAPIVNGKQMIHECEVEQIHVVNEHRDINKLDRYFIAIVPKDDVQEIEEDIKSNDIKLYYAIVDEILHYDPPIDWTEYLKIFVSDQNGLKTRLRSLCNGNTSKIITWGQVVDEKKEYSIIPYKIQEYNLPALIPYKALERWNKRKAMEEMKKGKAYESLDMAFKYKPNSLHKQFSFDNFCVLDVGCGPLANIWILTEEKGYVPMGNIYGIDIDEHALLAGKSVYGKELAKYKFDWNKQIHCCSAFKMPFFEEQFDFIFSISALENIVNSKKDIKVEKRDRNLTRKQRNDRAKEFIRYLGTLLKPNGSLYLSTFKKDIRLFLKEDMYSFTRKEIKSFSKTHH